MRFQSVDEWLSWQQTLNPATIKLGLERVREVFARLGIDKVGTRVISIAGTNGKGSTVAGYETWLRNAGYSVASYTSPHLLRYNERIRLNGEPVSDELICQAFERVDQARGNVELTYFEFGTLAAMQIFSDFQPDVAIMEIGLGGRLDAVNIIDADLAHITTIGLDHQAWLGDTREQIGYEKAGIVRHNRLALCNDADPPKSVVQALQQSGGPYRIRNVDYQYRWLDDQSIEWRDDTHQVIMQPVLPGRHQADNISGVLAGLSLLGELDGVSAQQIAERFNGMSCAGRLQRIDSTLPVPLFVDVGHNVDAAKALAEFLQSTPCSGRVCVLLGMLEDKDQQGFVASLQAQVDEWWLLDLHTVERGLSAQQLLHLSALNADNTRVFETAENALAHAMSCLDNQDILLVTGSFMTVEAAMKTSFVNRP